MPDQSKTRYRGNFKWVCDVAHSYEMDCKKVLRYLSTFKVSDFKRNSKVLRGSTMKGCATSHTPVKGNINLNLNHYEPLDSLYKLKIGLNLD